MIEVLLVSAAVLVPLFTVCAVAWHWAAHGIPEWLTQRLPQRDSTATSIAPGPVWIKGHCRHLEVVPVTSVLGEEVAQLCKTCEEQFEPRTFDLSQARTVAQLVFMGWPPEAAVAVVNDDRGDK